MFAVRPRGAVLSLSVVPDEGWPSRFFHEGTPLNLPKWIKPRLWVGVPLRDRVTPCTGGQHYPGVNAPPKGARVPHVGDLSLTRDGPF
ncbi:hypothetical protein GCM10009551_041310 [Nocardiopsis tropica]